MAIEKAASALALGLRLRDEGQYEAAREQFQEAVRLFNIGPEQGSLSATKGERRRRDALSVYLPWTAPPLCRWIPWTGRQSRGGRTLVELLARHGKSAPVLRYAAKNGLGDVVRVLLHLNDISRVDSGTGHLDTNAAFILAARGGHWTTAQTLLRYYYTEGRQTAGANAARPVSLVDSEDWGSVTEVATLTDTGPRRSWFEGTIDASILPALSRAVLRGEIYTVETLVDIGTTDLNERDDEGRTPLAWAVRARNMAAVKLLLDTGRADPSAKDRNGLTPLTWAAIYGDDGCLQWLLDAKSERKWWRRRSKARTEPTYRDEYEYALFS